LENQKQTRFAETLERAGFDFDLGAAGLAYAEINKFDSAQPPVLI